MQQVAVRCVQFDGLQAQSFCALGSARKRVLDPLHALQIE